MSVKQTPGENLLSFLLGAWKWILIFGFFIIVTGGAIALLALPIIILVLLFIILA